MVRRQAVIVAVALAVALAGCSAVPAGLGGVASDADGDSVAGDGTDAAGDAASRDGIALTDSEQTLRTAGSFTATWSFLTVESDGNASSITNVFRVDIDEERAFESFAIDGEESAIAYERFSADGTTYTKFGDGEETFFQVSAQETSLFDRAFDRALYSYDDVEDATYVGQETFDGVTVDRYEYTDRASWQQYGAGAFTNEEDVTITDFTVVVLVDESGLARSTSWTLTGNTDDGSPVSAEWQYDVTGVGETTVADTSWLGDAIAAAETETGS